MQGVIKKTEDKPEKPQGTHKDLGTGSGDSWREDENRQTNKE